MYQNLVIAGYLGNDPEMRYTSSGMAVSNFSVATKQVWNDAQGERHEDTTWFRCSAWGRLAETVNQYLKKGSGVLVEGTVKANAFTKQDGTAAASLEVRVDQLRFLDRSGTKSTQTEDETPVW